jgi:hypothetical protein
VTGGATRHEIAKMRLRPSKNLNRLEELDEQCGTIG